MAAADVAVGAGDAGGYVAVPPHLRSRPLYLNPVCFLVTANAPPADAASSAGAHDAVGGPAWNVMTVSWLTPIDNGGAFAMSINASRHTARNLLHGRAFTLSAAAAGAEATLRAVGGVSGRDVDKAATIPGLRFVEWPLPADDGGGGSAAAPLPVVGGCPVVMRCAVLRELVRPEDSLADDASVDEAAGSGSGGGGGAGDGRERTDRDRPPPHRGAGAAARPRAARPARTFGHHLLLCRVVEAAVEERYWASGKSLSWREGGSGEAPLLSFVGGGEFAAMHLPRSASGRVRGSLAAAATVEGDS